jgi:CRP-like cAMP-binding protein
LIGSGTFQVIKHPGTPQEKLLATLGPGEFFGEMCIIECMPRAATVRVIEAGVLYSLNSGDLLRIFKQWPDQYAILMLNIARDLCRRLRALHELLIL